MAGLDWLTSRPIAHRGLHDSARGIIENTLPAIHAAIEAGYGIEVDVQPARDLEPVVYHDETLERLTTGSGPVGNLSAAELAELRFHATDARIPTLRQLLDLVAARMPLVIEIKTDWTGMETFCGRVGQILESYPGPVAIMSFDPLAVAAIRRLAPALPRGIVAESFKHWKPEGTTARQRLLMRHLLHSSHTLPHFVAYGVEDLPAVAPLALRTIMGLPILAWTVRSPQQRKRAKWWASQMIFEGFRP